jgi:hypothetical protein
MWSLTSPRAKRINGPKKFRSSPKKDFFNIGAKRPFDVSQVPQQWKSSGYSLFHFACRLDASAEYNLRALQVSC